MFGRLKPAATYELARMMPESPLPARTNEQHINLGNGFLVTTPA